MGLNALGPKKFRIVTPFWGVENPKKRGDFQKMKKKEKLGKIGELNPGLLRERQV